MRRFSSYGPVDTQEHYYVPRKELIERAYTQLLGYNPKKGGNYFTVWAPRQTGKTWVMQQILFRLQQDPRFDILKINLEHLKEQEDVSRVIRSIATETGEKLGKDFSHVETREQFQNMFKKDSLQKPLILILDEFDSLAETCINAIVGTFRNISISRMDEMAKTTEQKTYLLHSVALIGVRSVLGVDVEKGSPFNVQRSLHIPNLTLEEVTSMFQWYEKDSGRGIQKEVLEELFYETGGQPGLTCWFGELLTEGFDGYTPDPKKSITPRDFEIVYAAATYALPNNNILNLISKAEKEPEKAMVLEMFQTDRKLAFRFDDKTISSLYMNGIAEKEVEDGVHYYLKFSCPFVQKRLFNYFSNELFSKMGTLVEPFQDLDHVLVENGLSIPGLAALYRGYLSRNRSWLFKDVPRRSDLKIYEAVFHFNLFSYLDKFLRPKGGRVFPEFPTGNGKIDLVITYRGKTYGIELKSFSDLAAYRASLKQAALYGKQLNLPEIYLLVFVASIPEETRKTYEVDFKDPDTQVTVISLFIETGE